MTPEAAMQKDHSKPKSELGGVVVLDFGGQYTQLIARRIREQQVFSAILPCTAKLEEIRSYQPAGIVLSGGPSSVYDADAPKCDPAVLAAGIPVLGICYGMQWIAKTLGGRVEPAGRREYGRADFAAEHAENGELFRGLPGKLRIWNSHGDHVLGLPPGFRSTGKTENAIAAIQNSEKQIHAVQFHPEVKHTEQGTAILRNFLFAVCRAEPKWSGSAFVAETVRAIRGQVGEKRAICALSGGVDSTVAAVLVDRAMGDRLTNVFVNTGLLRRNEFEDTLSMYRERLGLHVVGVDATDRFLAELDGVSDPEEKRKRIGREFIQVFAGEAARLERESGQQIDFLVQGTLYPDVI
ncbi:MAG TPA: glutamine-hydrolyzing GMP synthase, partial [Candidatus Acidoferrum sp.]|nr:glutamine-hydrolyzing GMP synthase [Candidatus Acidoferrum sp.]